MRLEWDELEQLSRDDIVEILEGYSFACFPNESAEKLRTALAVNVGDGTIPASVVRLKLREKR